MSAIFLSYAGTDRQVAAQIAQGLQGTGVNVWWDREGIGWGDNWIQKLEDALSQCGGYIILVGSSGVRKWVKAELSVAIKRHFEEELPVFSLLLPGVTPEALPPFLALLQAEALPKNLSALDYGKLAQALSQRGLVQPSNETPLVPCDKCPFPGLEAFGETDAQFFVGRQKETLDAVSGLGNGLDGVYRRWVQVEGTSGVGKSSLVKAGMIPTIKKGWAGSMEAGTWESWRVVEPMRPGADPILNLAEVLSKNLSPEPDPLTVSKVFNEVYPYLQEDDQALRVRLRGWIPEKQALVLVVDQLEELFTLTTDNTRRAHFDALLANALTDQDGPLHLITTIRTDFMMQFNAVPRLQALLNEKASRYFLTPITEYGLKDVVRTPGRLTGLTWSDPELPTDIVKEASGEPGALPLVENLLRLLWHEARDRQSYILSRQFFNELGGVGGALAKSADALLNSFGDGKQKALHLLTSLVNVGSASQDMQDTRRTIPKAVALQAAGGGLEAEEILNQLSGLRGQKSEKGMPARPRLVVVSNGGEKDTKSALVDLAHETLLRYDQHKQPYWKTLRDEITKRRRTIENRQLAEALAKEWRDQGGSPWRGLATRAQRKAFRRLPDLSPEAQDFVRASNRQAIRQTALWALAAMVLFTGAGLAGWAQSKDLTMHLAAKVLLTQAGLDFLSPEMVDIPAGTFTMGSDIDRPEERPAHSVNIPRSFRLARYEVTFDDYEPFVRLTGGGIVSDEGWGRGRRPAINVSWHEAQKYAEWLSAITGKSYRLPTEAEWEYAARSGDKQEKWAGTSKESELGDYAVYSGNSDQKTAEVGSKQANGFRLFDLSGNVWEWVEDCWHESYNNAPDDGSGWLEAGGGDCGRRVIRGGSWGDGPEDVRSAYRFRYPSVIRDFDIGFRLAQDTP